MLTRVRRSAAAAGCVLLAGCFHQVVSTGLPAGNTKVERPWTSTFIFGLVEAKPINVRQECPSGAAVIESKFTVMNWLGAAVTLGIWYPWHVTVTCASGGQASLDPATSTVRLGVSPAASIEHAAQLSRASGVPVALVWDAATPHPSEVAR